MFATHLTLVRRKSACLILAAAFAVTACGGDDKKNPIVSNVDFKVTYAEPYFSLSLVLKNLVLDGGVRVPLPNTTQSHVEMMPDFASNGTQLAVYLHRDDVKALSGVNFLDPKALPDGRPLPGVVGGTLPSLAIQVPKLRNITFYFGPKAFGTFIPVKLGLKEYMATFRLYSSDGNRVGNISMVGENGQATDQPYNGSGLLFLIQNTGVVQTLLK